MKRISLLLVCVMFVMWAPETVAQDSLKRVSLAVEARADCQYEYNDGVKNKSQSGIKGNMLDVFLQGRINKNLSYKYRQRLNELHKDKAFFDATDWLYLEYAVNRHLSVLAGKWAVLVGGWEFDPAPIDVFQLSEFCYHFPCYEWGVSALLTTGRSKFVVQLIRSPFTENYCDRADRDDDMWAGALVWMGNYGPVHTLWSVNMMEREPGKWINYIGLGTRVDLSRNVSIDVDVLNRYAHHQRFLLADASVMSRLEWRAGKHFTAFAKFSYDVNRAGTSADECLAEGTEITRLGGGVEYFPLGTPQVRLHLQGSYAFGKNPSCCAVVRDKQTFVDMGLTWRMKVL